jgi:nucleoside-diphosphate-sugar epimerase
MYEVVVELLPEEARFSSTRCFHGRVSSVTKRPIRGNPVTLIIGCGRIGQRLAHRCLQRGEAVTGVVRSAASAVALKAQGIEPLPLDLDREPLPHLPSRNRNLFYLAPPPERGSRDPRPGRVLQALDRDGLPARVVYISTTGVYGDCGGDWIDETRPAHPAADRARRRLDAERQLQAWAEKTGTELTILRVAGIYGPERLPLERIRKGLPVVEAQQAPFTNRIHEDDLVQVCLAAMDRPVAGETFNVSDGRPGTMAEYFDAVAERAGLPLPPKISMREAAARLSPGMLSYMRESRRLKNDKMLRLLGVKLRYPTLAEGLADSMASSTSPTKPGPR